MNRMKKKKTIIVHTWESETDNLKLQWELVERTEHGPGRSKLGPGRVLYCRVLPCEKFSHI
jgi:hypothetical protein